MNLSEWLHGKGVAFEVDGARFVIRQPMTEEYDDALSIYETVLQSFQTSLKELSEVPVADLQALADMLETELASEESVPKIVRLQEQIESLRSWSVQQYVAHRRALRSRNRFLTQRLLCDEHGNQIITGTDEEQMILWEALPMSVKDAAIPAIEEVMEAVNEAPFDLDKWRERALSSVKDSEPPHTESA